MGNQKAFAYLMNIISADRNRKYDWLQDVDIFPTPEDIPIRLIDGKKPEIIIYDQENHEIIDDGDILDKKCNIIIETSMMKAYTTEVANVVAENDRDYAEINQKKSVSLIGKSEDDALHRFHRNRGKFFFT